MHHQGSRRVLTSSACLIPKPHLLCVCVWGGVWRSVCRLELSPSENPSQKVLE